MTPSDFTHFDANGRPQMVDVGEKPFTLRTAVAMAKVVMNEGTKGQIEERKVKKGDVLSIAELAGVMAAKRTPDLIPLCHPVPLTKVKVDTQWLPPERTGTAVLQITASVTADYRTGVEMEALTACTVAGLTVYDMCKAVDRGMTLEAVQLLHKSGGKSGTFDRLDGNQV